VEVENVERLLAKACRELGAFALGWNERHLCNRIYDIWRFAFFNGNRVIPLARRRRIARLAADLRGVSGSLDGEFLEVLRDLAEAGRWCARELAKNSTSSAAWTANSAILRRDPNRRWLAGGQSPNAGGLSREKRGLIDLARERSPAALDKIFPIMNDETVPPAGSSLRRE
jgi:hypothetical protein